MDIKSIEIIDPRDCKPSSFHIRGDTSVSEEFVQNVKRVGVIQPIIVQEQENKSYAVIDGVRRVKASKSAGKDKIPALIINTDDELSLSLTATLGVWSKETTDSDREAALHQLTTGKRKNIHKFESKEPIYEAREQLGLDTLEDRLLRLLEPVDGIGESAIKTISEEFESVKQVKNANREQLINIDGIGKKKSDNIVSYLTN